MPYQKLTLPALTIAALLLTSLTGCGDKSESKLASQVAAKVGGSEISVHQINQVLNRTNTTGIRPEAAKAITRDILEKLIDQQLAVDQAIEAKLHRVPEVVAQIEAARLEILARAYLQQISGEFPKPSAQETKKYFDDNSQLFAQRHIFNIQEIVLPTSAGTPEVREQLRDFVSVGKPIEESAAWLKSKNIKFSGGSATRAAEQIPLDLLPRIHALKGGQSAFIESPQTLTLLRVASSQLVPVTEAEALPRIEQYLANQRTNDALTAKIKQLRATTTIEYVGDFSSGTLEKGVAGLK